MPKHRNKQHWNNWNPGSQRHNRQSAQNFQRNMSQDFYNGYCNQTNIPPNASYYSNNLDFQNNYSHNYSNNYYDSSYHRNFTQSHIQSNFNQKHEMNFTQNATNTELNPNFQRIGRESSSSSINDTKTDIRQNNRTKNVKKKSAKTNPWYKKHQTNQKTKQQSNQQKNQQTNQQTNQPTNQPTNQQTNQPTNQQTNQETNQQTNQSTNLQTNIINNTPPAKKKGIKKQKRNFVAEYYKITENFTEKGYIIKETLYKDPSLFYANANSDTDLTSNDEANDNKWTDTFWQKHDFSTALVNSRISRRPGKVSRKNQNRLERSLNAMLSKPAEISKGKSLLEKMGWRGGGLGRDGDGIIEPIAPKATYAVNTIGLGHGTEKPETPKTPIPFSSIANKTLKRRPAFQNNFCMNVLLYILEFVKNDEENKIVFEPRLSKLERKKIHQIVEKVRESDNLDDFKTFENFSDKHLKVVSDIWVHNCYELWTESEGEKESRRICLFKEAPAHVYLVTPDDFTENDESNDKNEIIPKMEINDQIIIISDGSDTENEVTMNDDKNKVIKEENQQSVVKKESNMPEEANICNDIVVKIEINENISDTTTNINIHDAVKLKLENDEETYDIAVKMEINENISDTTTNINIHDPVKPKLENDDDISVKMEINENISHATTNINIHDAVKPKLENDEETCDIAVKMEMNDQNTKNDEIVSKKTTNIDNNDDVPKLESDNCLENVLLNDKTNQKNAKESVLVKMEINDQYTKNDEVVSKKATNIDNNDVQESDNYLENVLLNDKADQKSTEESVLAKIVKYFKEFSSDETFEEFRFLGPFTNEEIMHINMFFDICMKQDDIECDEKYELLAAFDNDSVEFIILEDNNGKTFIKKVGDSPELPFEDEDVVYASGVYL